MVDLKKYGWLRVHLEYPEQSALFPQDYGVTFPIAVVEQADPVVSASAELIEGLALDDLVCDDVLTVGTEGKGLGVVRYRISDHPAGPQYRVLTLEGTDRDR